MSKEHAASITLVASSGGVFEITVDGSLLFSKKKLGRFPEEGEVAGLIDRMRKTEDSS